MKDNIKRLFALFLFGFLVLIGQLAYWQVIKAPALLTHSGNQRALELEKSVWRGGIYDRYGEILAISKMTGQDQQIRSYPLAEKTAQVIGYSSTRYGKSGLESSYNGELLGIAEDSPIKDWLNKLLGRKKRGEDLILTLDSSLQQAAYKALGNHRGAVVALNPRTGEILALVSKPSFSPENIAANWSQLNTDKNSPLLNRATQGLYPPGSTLKVLIAGAALEKGVTDVNEIFNCPGYLSINGKKLWCYHHTAHGRINLAEAVKVSCNVTFAQLGIRLGINGLNDYLDKLNWSGNQSLGFSLAQSNLLKGKYLSSNGLAQRAIGQGQVLATPFYMARLAGAIANNGRLMQPYLVAEIRNFNGKVIKKNQPVEQEALFTPTTTARLSQFMQGVVEEGTGKSASIKGITMAGKTGTAENPHGDSHAWFLGFAPLENPQIAVAVLVENGGSGGAVAAPIAREIFLNALEKK